MGVQIIGSKRKIANVIFIYERKEIFEILRQRPLADHDVLTQPQFLARLFQFAALVIGVNAGCYVGVQIPAGKKRGMAVANNAAKGDQLCERLLASTYNPR